MSNNYLNAIYNGFINEKSLNQIHKDILKISKVSSVEDKAMQRYAIICAKQVARKLDVKVDKVSESNVLLSRKSVIADAVFLLMNKLKLWQNMNKLINKAGSEFEDDEKKRIIEDETKRNRSYDNAIVFYLASSHNDCAKDHKEYQGKMYIDEKWESVIKDKALKSMIKTYIIKNNVKGYNWVMGNPVYFITRPNCRHYFRGIATDEVLHYNISELISKYKMHRPIGRRQYLQTENYGGTALVKQDIRNAQLVYNKYKERYEYHKTLYNTQRTLTLKKAIDKDLTLMAKWKEYVRNKYGVNVE